MASTISAPIIFIGVSILTVWYPPDCDASNASTSFLFNGFSSGLYVPSPLFLAPYRPKLANAPVRSEAGNVISFGSLL